MRWHRHKWAMSAALIVAVLLFHTSAGCFPGVLVGKGGSSRVAHTAHVVLMLSGPVSVVTVMVDYEGALDPFALLVPVPPDVTLDRIRAVKREFVARLEQLSAPRFHAFFEKNPCEPGPVEQDWDVRYEVSEAGFPAPWFMPPPERNWTVPNEIGIATEPVFKQSENEFRFHVLAVSNSSELDAWLTKRGFSASPEALSALGQVLRDRRKLLVAEVNAQRAELLGNGGLQLGAIRYWSRQPVDSIASTLGLLNSAGVQDLFIYVLHPSQRFQVRNYCNLLLPTNIEVDPAAAEQLGTLYNALFDAQLSRNPASAVTEYVWPTSGCGEPCPNAPLTLYELMSLGGDIMEAQLVSSVARRPEPASETNEEKQQFEQQLQGKSASEKAQALRQHGNDRRELARRYALIARQRYVLSRLHFRYDRKTLPRDIELQAAAEHLEGGIGIPQGPKGVLFNGTHPAPGSHYQIRFMSLFSWTKSYQCQSPIRWRWGRRWKSLDSALRKVWLAEDLPRRSRDPSQLAALVQTPIVELGVTPKPPAPTLTAAPRGKPTQPSGCSLCHREPSSNWLLLLTPMALAFARKLRIAHQALALGLRFSRSRQGARERAKDRTNAFGQARFQR